MSRAVESASPSRIRSRRGFSARCGLSDHHPPGLSASTTHAPRRPAGAPPSAAVGAGVTGSAASQHDDPPTLEAFAESDVWQHAQAGPFNAPQPCAVVIAASAPLAVRAYTSPKARIRTVAAALFRNSSDNIFISPAQRFCMVRANLREQSDRRKDADSGINGCIRLLHMKPFAGNAAIGAGVFSPSSPLGGEYSAVGRLATFLPWPRRLLWRWEE